jgi:hypothetical protein
MYLAQRWRRVQALREELRRSGPLWPSTRLQSIHIKGWLHFDLAPLPIVLLVNKRGPCTGKPPLRGRLVTSDVTSCRVTVATANQWGHDCMQAHEWQAHFELVSGTNVAGHCSMGHASEAPVPCVWHACA